MTTQDQNQARDRDRIKEHLSAKGIVYEDIYSLGRDRHALSLAAPVLIDLLPEINAHQVKIDLIRVVSEAKVDPKPFVEELKGLLPILENIEKPPKNISNLSGNELVAELARIRAHAAATNGAESVAWALAEALRTIADETVYEDIVETMCDKRFGRARQMLPYALANVSSRRNETIGTLAKVLGDEDIAPHAIDALAGMGAIEAIPAIRPFLDSKDPLERKEAKRALKKLEKKSKRTNTETAAGTAAGTATDTATDTTAGTATGTATKSSARSPSEISASILENLVEASTNFDSEDIPPFLERLASMIEGFGQPEIQHLEDVLLGMEVGEENSFLYNVRYEGKEITLLITIFMGDVDAPDMGFFTEPGLASAIDGLIDELDELE